MVQAVAGFGGIDAEGGEQLSGGVGTLAGQQGEQEMTRLDAPGPGGGRFVEAALGHVRVGVVQPGGVATELGSHNKPEVRNQMIDPFYQQTDDIADSIAYMVTRPRHTAIGELWIMPTEQL